MVSGRWSLALGAGGSILDTRYSIKMAQGTRRMAQGKGLKKGTTLSTIRNPQSQIPN